LILCRTNGFNTTPEHLRQSYLSQYERKAFRQAFSPNKSVGKNAVSLNTAQSGKIRYRMHMPYKNTPFVFIGICSASGEISSAFA